MQDPDRRPDLRQPGGFRPAVRPSQRRGRLRRARSNSSMPGCPNSRAGCGDGDLAIFTADHGCDPTTPSTDHSREYVPLLVSGPTVPRRRESRTCAPRSPTSARPSPKISARASREGESFLPANLMRKPVMAGNWKMYKTPAETTAFFEKFRPLVEKSSHCEIVICPPFTNLAAAVAAVKGLEHPRRRAEYRLGQGRRLHGRDFRSHDSSPWAPATPSSATASAASISARPTRPC